jgi:hypothetical protein
MKSQKFVFWKMMKKFGNNTACIWQGGPLRFQSRLREVISSADNPDPRDAVVLTGPLTARLICRISASTPRGTPRT